MASQNLGSVGVLNISDSAVVDCNAMPGSALLIGGNGEGTLNMTGGSLTMHGNVIRIGADPDGSGQVNLDGGVMTGEFDTNPVEVGAYGNIDLEGNGLLKLKNISGGDWVDRLEDYVDAGRLTAYDNTGRASVVIEVQGDYTVAYASAVDFNLAWGSSPAIGDDPVPVGTVDLTWQPGDNTAATNGHIIYLGTDYNDVNDAVDTNDVTYLATTTDPNYLALSVPNYGEQFYWRVDQADASDGNIIYKGKVWNFSVTPFMLVEDFESYADTLAFNAVWSTTPASAITLNTDAGYAADGTAQSMMINFDNTGGSITKATITFGSGQNLSGIGLNALVLSFKGVEGNPAEPFSVTLKDGVGTSYAVDYVYQDDPHELDRGYWIDPIQWNIDLQAYVDNGVDLSNVIEGSIQVGDGVSTGTGWIFFDQIAFAKLEIIPDASQEEIITAVAPESSGLRAHYTFDETSGTTASDSSVNGFHGTVTNGIWGVNSAWDTDGKYNGCLKFNDEVYVSCPTDVININDEITVSVWVNGAPAWDGDVQGIFAGAKSGSPPCFTASVPFGSAWDYISVFDTGLGNNPAYDRADFIPVNSSQFEGQWNHYAFVKDAVKGIQQIYLNGKLISQNDEAFLQWNGSEEFDIGLKLNWNLTKYPYTGKLDDFRVYDYALSQAEIVSLAGLDSVNQDVPSSTE